MRDDLSTGAELGRSHRPQAGATRAKSANPKGRARPSRTSSDNPGARELRKARREESRHAEPGDRLYEEDGTAAFLRLLAVSSNRPRRAGEAEGRGWRSSAIEQRDAARTHRRRSRVGFATASPQRLPLGG